MIYKNKYYSVTKDGRVLSDGNWYPNNTIHKDYFSGEDISSEMDSVVYLEDVIAYTDIDSDSWNGFSCAECGKYFANDDSVIVTTDTSEIYCQSCAEVHGYECIDCHEFFKEDSGGYIDVNNDFVCGDCIDNWGICDDCGLLVYEDQAIYVDNDCYCPRCAANHPIFIKSYHSDMDYTPMTDELEKDLDTAKLKLFGFEIEVECGEHLAEITQELLGDTAILMHDGSVSGFEIVTRPMTEKYFYNHFTTVLNSALEYLKNNGAKAHNKGGIHIHFSLNNLRTLLINSNLYKLLHNIPVNSSDYKILLTISQRHSRALEDWASPNVADRYSTVRYDARTGTHEIRIFNSNLRIERIIKNFEVLLSMIEYSETFGEDCMNMKYYLQWVMQTQGQYECLKCFIKEKNILNIINTNYGNDNWFFDLFSRPVTTSEDITEEQVTCV